jgi:peroxiredoxin Q/BCP
MPNVGDNAPAFSLPDENGNPVSLGDFAGKWLVLYFYPKDNTSGCTKEARDFTERLQTFSELNAVVIGVSRDSAETHRRFIEKHELGISLLSDPEHRVHKAYGAWGLKKNYGKETMGVIRSTFLISPEGKIAAKWEKVKVRVKRKSGEVKHADIVAKKLAELQLGR